MTGKMFRDYTRREVMKLARQGRLMDEAFKVFQRMVYPGAPADQVAALRVAFFGGAAEFWALFCAAAEDCEDTTDDDDAFMSAVLDEIERAHERTATLAMAKAEGKPQ